MRSTRRVRWPRCGTRENRRGRSDHGRHEQRPDRPQDEIAFAHRDQQDGEQHHDQYCTRKLHGDRGTRDPGIRLPDSHVHHEQQQCRHDEQQFADVLGEPARHHRENTHHRGHRNRGHHAAAEQPRGDARGSPHGGQHHGDPEQRRRQVQALSAHVAEQFRHDQGKVGGAVAETGDRRQVHRDQQYHRTHRGDADRNTKRSCDRAQPIRGGGGGLEAEQAETEWQGSGQHVDGRDALGAAHDLRAARGHLGDDSERQIEVRQQPQAGQHRDGRHDRPGRQHRHERACDDDPDAGPHRPKPAGQDGFRVHARHAQRLQPQRHRRAHTKGGVRRKLHQPGEPRGHRPEHRPQQFRCGGRTCGAGVQARQRDDHHRHENRRAQDADAVEGRGSDHREGQADRAPHRHRRRMVRGGRPGRCPRGLGHGHRTGGGSSRHRAAPGSRRARCRHPGRPWSSPIGRRGYGRRGPSPLRVTAAIIGLRWTTT
ncbi:hypothetical protein MSMEI_5663 [Mycolicibacterium smegmatis MC2 155]|uniref:Uncharacterized protein n=1 Tax=Mycolicibacterium smegmatis (strain ATCC 700084 / mc(2)155) TaxID=246196 RepID=I7FT91_MYCS2|nr:hypothetical protein MSMEI_5663 [Mycolicibacterium smegmatis MC2 155]